VLNDDHDENGKYAFDHIYTQSDPRDYFTVLQRFDYGIPGIAQPYFARLVTRYRGERGVVEPRILDIGCSYGINTALLRCDATMATFYQRYTDIAIGRSRAELVASDQAFVRARQRPGRARLVGLDTSGPALDYAVEAGFLDEAIEADFETGEPTEAQLTQLAGTDLVISTGCVGYVTEKTLLRVIEAAGEQRPWMAHFCLRMFPYDVIAGHLDDLGYETIRVDQPVRQRRFATDQERTAVLDRLAGLGIDSRGLEADGWFYTQLYVSRPR
jgi:SAM-dependent methyltransferase